MKFILLKRISFCIFLLGFIFSSCKRELKEWNLEIAALDPLNADTGAGNWKTILLTHASEFDLDAPLAINTQQYKTELLEIKSWQANMNEQDEAVMNYWAAGHVLRWNEILRELVAKYNLPPYQNHDGTYPSPNPANPLAYPYFPFANPPYAARAYAYVSAAQYDALVAAYHYKGVFKRLTPHQADPSIIEKIHVVEGYSYPSEAGIIAGVTSELLKLLFPGEQAFIQQKLNEAKHARLMAGANVRSDIEAGEKLGRLVAQKFADRARSDLAGKAAGTAADWQKMENDTRNKGEEPWLSMESPKRPPMLPLFGRVKGFLMDSNEVVNARPPAPPSTNSSAFNEQLNEVLHEVNNTDRKKISIVHLWADGVGTYTPPGHWNDIACKDFVKLRFSEVRWARNLALLNMALFDAVICCWDVKYHFYVPRPSQMNKKIKTLTGLPNFPSFTSGHSTFSGAAAKFLAHVNPSNQSSYFEMANEASMSRLYGGIHYRMDCEVGLEMGYKIGQKAVERAKSDGAE